MPFSPSVLSDYAPVEDVQILGLHPHLTALLARDFSDQAQSLKILYGTPNRRGRDWQATSCFSDTQEDMALQVIMYMQ